MDMLPNPAQRELLPNPYPHAHGSGAEFLADGRLLVTYFAGTIEGSEDQVVVFAVRDPAGRWAEPAVAVPRIEFEGETLVPEEAVPALRPDGGVELLFWASPLSGFRLEEKGWRAGLKIRRIPTSRPFRAAFDGMKLGPVRGLFPERGIVLLNRGLTLPSGEFLLPITTERPDAHWHTRFLICGPDWREFRCFGDIYAAPGSLEPCVAPLSDGRLLCLMRYGAENGWLWRSESADLGRTWSAPERTGIPNPSSPAELLRLKSGRLVLSCNPSLRGRSPLAIAVSEDDGATWSAWKIDEGEGQYCYPSLAQDPADGLVHLIYTHRRKCMAHVAVREESLLGGEMLRT